MTSFPLKVKIRKIHCQGKTLQNLRSQYHGAVDLSAYILAGGKSTRMGADKAFLELAGRTLLDRALELASSRTSNVRIVGDPAKFSGFAPTVPDSYFACGPLGGIHAALENTSTDLNLILAVDLPFLIAELLQYVVDRAQKSDALVTVPRMAGRWQPLCAVYRKQFAAIAERSLKAGEYKIDRLFTETATQVIAESELARLGVSAETFQNLNTPEELERARHRISGN